MRNDQPVILLVDDDQEIRQFMQLYLHNEGYRILQATNGKEALQLADSHAIDLMVLDLMMPEMDGLEACIRIREKYWMPIIMLTAKTNDLDKIQGLSMGRRLCDQTFQSIGAGGPDQSSFAKVSSF